MIQGARRHRPGLLLGLALMLLAQPASAVPALLVATPEGLRPVAIIEGDKFFPPAREARLQQILGNDLLEAKRELPLFENGEERMMFQLERFQVSPPGCAGAGLWLGKPERPLDRPLLSFSPDFPGPRRYVGNLPVAAYTKLAQEMSLKVYRAKRLSEPLLNAVKVRKLEAFTLMNGTRNFVSVASDVFSPAKACPDYSLLLILEKIGRRWQTQLEHFRHNTKDCAQYSLVGSFGTGSKIDKLAVQGSSPTARWYDLYQAQSFGGLKKIFHGGGHSCLSQSVAH
ncbi:MAG: hypothetical protein CVV27_15635 [Candidatus Melainabacteria bacterium HGW-Melainabacteria-1]|nr:MAG: hypothetical protein CVV27_15635 [Candidatus Melainabacteria bacterium HGW-Melainabacteria-1]